MGLLHLLFYFELFYTVLTNGLFLILNHVFSIAAENTARGYFFQHQGITVVKKNNLIPTLYLKFPPELNGNHNPSQ